MPKRIPVPADVTAAVRQRPASYPVLLVVASFKNEADPAFEDFTAMVHGAIWEAGHGSCGAWQFIPESSLITCACGDALFQVSDPVTAAEAAA